MTNRNRRQFPVAAAAQQTDSALAGLRFDDSGIVPRETTFGHFH